MVDSIPQRVLNVTCMICGAKGIWKPKYNDDKNVTVYRCYKCGNNLQDCEWD